MGLYIAAGNPVSLPGFILDIPGGGKSDEPATMLHRIDFEIGIYPNRVQVSDRRSGRFVDFAAEMPFSSPRRLVADPVYFENALAKAMRKAMSGGFILLDAQATIVPGGGATLDAGERQTIRRVLRDIGFRTVRFQGAGDDERIPPIPAGFAKLF